VGLKLGGLNHRLKAKRLQDGAFKPQAEKTAKVCPGTINLLLN